MSKWIGAAAVVANRVRPTSPVGIDSINHRVEHHTGCWLLQASAEQVSTCQLVRPPLPKKHPLAETCDRLELSLGVNQKSKNER